MGPPDSAAGQPPGMRERKKACTRQRLLDAAFALFAEYGFEATTVEVIAARADVHPRTFFRHFATKEDVVVDENRARLDRILEAFAAEPDDAAVLTGLRRACRAGIEGYQEEHSTLHLELSLIATVPALQAANMEAALSWQRSLTAEIARRLGVDPEQGLQARLIAASTLTALHVSVETWLTDSRSTKLGELVDEALTLLEAGLEASLSPTTR